MAHSTTFTCDRCGKTVVDDQNFLKNIRVQIESPYILRNEGFAKLKCTYCGLVQKVSRKVRPDRRR
jgi:ribosomal protein S27E